MSLKNCKMSHGGQESAKKSVTLYIEWSEKIVLNLPISIICIYLSLLVVIGANISIGVGHVVNGAHVVHEVVLHEYWLI